MDLAIRLGRNKGFPKADMVTSDVMCKEYSFWP